MNTSANYNATGARRPESRHAVVLGGSLAGLLAARVLSDHFEHVTLIERDVFPNTPDARRGIPQANHVHGLLLRGRQILEELFPGLQDEMIAEGAPLLDMANDISWYTRAGWGVRFPSDFKVLAFTRPLLDFHVRRRISENPRIEIMDNTEVLRLLPDCVENRVSTTGEDFRYQETDGGTATLMTKFMHRYMEHVLDLSTRVVTVRKVLMEVFNIVAPPTTLFQPRVLFRVLVQMLLKGKVDENAHRNHGGERSLDRDQPVAKEFRDELFAGRSQTGKAREFVFTDGSQAENT